MVMQIRLIGTHAEVQNTVTELSRLFTVTSVSTVYPVYCRRPGRRRSVVPGMARIYLEVTR